MFYTIYQITNLINGKIYVGLHKTKDLNDSYMGSGIMIKRAIKKHGHENFKKEILFIFDNYQDMLSKEIELVTEEFCLREDTYNMAKGGGDGWSYANRVGKSNIGWKTNGTNENHLKGGKNSWSKYSEEDRLKRIEICRRDLTQKQGFKNKKHTEETKIRMSKSNTGEKNSQYGKIWIHSLEHKISKRINKEECIPEGWHLGRKIKFND